MFYGSELGRKASASQKFQVQVRKKYSHSYSYEIQYPSLHQSCLNKSRAGDMNTVSILMSSMLAANSARFDLHGQCSVCRSSDVINGRRGTDGAP